MQTKNELLQWLKCREKELIDLHYDLIDSLNYSEIDKEVRILRGHIWDFEQKINIVKRNLTKM